MFFFESFHLSESCCYSVSHIHQISERSQYAENRNKEVLRYWNEIFTLTLRYLWYRNSALASSWSSKCFFSSSKRVCGHRRTSNCPLLKTEKKNLSCCQLKRPKTRKSKHNTLNIKSGETSCSIRFLSFPRMLYNLSNETQNQSLFSLQYHSWWQQAP